MTISQRYQLSLTLLTDMYQLTMAQGYWKKGLAEQEAVFHLYFRKNPFKGGYTVCAGLADALDLLQNFKFTEGDLTYLKALTGSQGQPLFEEGFLQHLRDLTFTCDVDAIPEGTVVFPNEPLLRIKGPILQCQLLETPLLTILNFQTLVATKAARVVEAAQGDPVLEFGMRRAQGPDGALSAARAAFIGGVAATSNVLAGQLFNIPVKGTHAHSWVMSFEEEQESFAAYAEVFPHDSVFLVDTYHTLEGIQKAIEVAREMRKNGAELKGIRLDSGDLAYLSIEGRRMLDEAGFSQVAILASNDLDEYLIESLKLQGAKIDTWGIGTKLVTAYDQPALGGVYKLAALRQPNGEWEYKVKLSEQLAKISTPGILQVRRFSKEGALVGDMIYSEPLGISPAVTMVHPNDPTQRKNFTQECVHEDLLVPVFKAGEQVYTSPDLRAIQQRTKEQLQLLHGTYRRFLNPHLYKVGLEEQLHEKKLALIVQLRTTAQTKGA
ncbi:nicotinate phosphoribosyltransferase [Rufibacter glacialis]|uniref:Nicotinate phosphoribosyltransferase n=1 Tax=Rufibacter glacialis TaxID=1259555 RepID=A0A5M8QE37_9BACT|nr:nicotinate phosphoribosyltransferase [Rufibacter glacialis]KAA6434297.1 nicotinate phosphoribosyltransferase [Rufibacter glacialis]GGK68374.1 nicotinate phosphoribosyltransferase [Rufibacter glacialis]